MSVHNQTFDTLQGDVKAHYILDRYKEPREAHARTRGKSTCIEATSGARTGSPNTLLSKHHLLTKGGRKRVASHKLQGCKLEDVCTVNRKLLHVNEDIRDSRESNYRKQNGSYCALGMR